MIYRHDGANHHGHKPRVVQPVQRSRETLGHSPGAHAQRSADIRDMRKDMLAKQGNGARRPSHAQKGNEDVPALSRILWVIESINGQYGIGSK